MTASITSCGCDLGTAFIQTARDDDKGTILYNTVRDCYRTIEYDQEFEATLKAQGAQYLVGEGKIYVLGNDAYLQAGMAEFGASQQDEREEILGWPMKNVIFIAFSD